ncbi:MAG: energy transducer TonB [Acidobacteriaceae bacterium]|nr:energy transducer TonB [Acidobacteriaceae bacterium]MBV9499734.1 energy transducer TonB [Acidobacteriaceae bacterium]
MSVALHDYASWQHPFRQQRIYIRSAVIQSLATEALRSIKGQQVGEIGGILWGTRPSAADEPLVIDDAELVPSEGRLYNATAADTSNLARALRNRKPGSDLSCVGYFRTSIDDDLRLTARDQELIEKEIRDPDAVFLIIKPFDIGVCMAGFFFWEDGQLQTDVSDLEVPFIVTETSKLKDSVTPDVAEAAIPESQAWPVVEKPSLATSESQTQPPKAVPKPPITPNGHPEPAHFPRGSESQAPKADESAGVASEAAVPTASESLPRAHKFAWWRGWPLLNLILGLVLLVLAGTLTYSVWSGSRLRLQSSIGLKVVRASDGQLNVSWNGNAPLVAKAQGGKLTILDGTISHPFTLDSAQLRSSRIFYMPSGADVQFVLEIYSKNNQRVTQSVRVLSSDLASGRDTSAVTVLVKPATRVAQSRAPAKPRGHDRSRAGGETKSQPAATASKPEVNTAPERKNPPKAPVKTEEVPDARKMARALPLHPSPSPARAPKNSNPVLPRRDTEIPDSSPMIALVDGKKRAIYMPPQPLEKVMPDMRSLSGLTIDRNIQVTVHVTVDLTGRVVEADLSAVDFNTSSALVQAAIAAARQWTFQPATLDGKATSAEHIIVFKFHP